MARELAGWTALAETTLGALVRELNLRLARLADHVARLQRLRVRTVTAATTLTDGDDLVLVDTTAGNVTVTLPPAASARRDRPYVVKKLVAANTLTLAAAGSETIDGAATVAWTTQWQVTRVVSDGSAWYTV